MIVAAYTLVFYETAEKRNSGKYKLCHWLTILSAPAVYAVAYIWHMRFSLDTVIMLALMYAVFAGVMIILHWPHPDTVEAMKAAAADGKLTEDQIRTLKADLLRMTRKKLAEPTVQLLEAAKLDINAMIQGAAEDLINQMHTTQQLIAGELIVE